MRWIAVSSAGLQGKGLQKRSVFFTDAGVTGRLEASSRFVGSSKTCRGPQFTVTRAKHRGVRFRRIRDFEQYYFNSIPPTSHYCNGYIYIYIYNLSIYLSIHLSVYLSIAPSLSIYIYIYTHVCKHIYIYIYRHMCMHMHMHVYIDK